jgi:glycosyltransferase involved in cell wall biosynthesis
VASGNEASPQVSVIVCTRNRATFLRDSIEVLLRAASKAPSAEIIVVDNASTDETAELLRSLAVEYSALRLASAPVPGLSRARNVGVAAARGAAVLFTDDDVFVPEHCVVALARPLLSGAADAVTGGITMARDLERPWMNEKIHVQLAHRPEPLGDPPITIGANMGVTRAFAERIRFDEELGAPPYQAYDDILFHLQLKEAGARIVGVFDAQVEHRFDPDRLAWEALVAKWNVSGRGEAYLWHHFLHADLTFLRLRLAKHRALLAWRSRHWAKPVDVDGLALYGEVAFQRELLALRGTPRNYDRYGLDKHVSAAEHAG